MGIYIILHICELHDDLGSSLQHFVKIQNRMTVRAFAQNLFLMQCFCSSHT